MRPSTPCILHPPLLPYRSYLISLCFSPTLCSRFSSLLDQNVREGSFPSLLTSALDSPALPGRPQLPTAFSLCYLSCSRYMHHMLFLPSGTFCLCSSLFSACLYNILPSLKKFWKVSCINKYWPRVLLSNSDVSLRIWTLLSIPLPKKKKSNLVVKKKIEELLLRQSTVFSTCSYLRKTWYMFFFVPSLHLSMMRTMGKMDQLVFT